MDRRASGGLGDSGPEAPTATLFDGRGRKPYRTERGKRDKKSRPMGEEPPAPPFPFSVDFPSSSSDWTFLTLQPETT
ncbi:hypothetical protein U1Q18_003091 [Sarracenia purpurea var. burkii]